MCGCGILGTTILKEEKIVETRFNRLKIMSLVLAAVSLLVAFGMYARICTLGKQVEQLAKYTPKY